MEEKTEAVKCEETTVGLTMNYNPFSFISCQEDALVLAGCISHGLDADVIKKSRDLFATARAMLLDACVCLLYRQGGDSMSMQGLVDLLGESRRPGSPVSTKKRETSGRTSTTRRRTDSWSATTACAWRILT